MIKRIRLQNYRCFEDFELSLTGGINLLIGDNASGKTTVLKALSTVLSSFFLGFKDENTVFPGLRSEDFRNVKIGSTLLNDLPVQIGFEYDLPISRDRNLFDYLETAMIIRSSRSRSSRTQTKPLTNFKRVAKHYHTEFFQGKEQILPLPVLAHFSTSDIHSGRKISPSRFTKLLQRPSFGYYECMQGDGFLPYWTKRLLVLKEAGQEPVQISGVRKALKKALGASGCNIIEDFDIRINAKKVFYLLIDGRESETSQLSDGYRRIVNLVVDIAFRCMLLNGNKFGVEAIEKSFGTVLIDEVDLHLHPSLQTKVVSSLQHAFTNIQFVFSSHSPLVMSGVKSSEDNQIIKLKYDTNEPLGYSAKLVEAYGMDASTILDVLLNVIPRSKEVDDKLTKLFDLIDQDSFDAAQANLLQLKTEFGENLPELSRAESMLNFLTSDFDKD